MRSRLVQTASLYVTAGIVLVVWLLPFALMVIGSLKETQSIIEADFSLLFRPTLEHYRYIFARQDFFSFALNSVIVAFATTLVTMSTGTLAAYSISRFQTGGRAYELWILLARMAPPAVLTIPFFLMFRSVDLTNTVWALVIADTTFILPFVVWTMRGFLDEIPVELEEAAQIDGATKLGALARVVLPITLPGIIATTIFCAIFAWNEYLFALTLATATSSKTLPVAAGDFITGYAINWGPVFASGTLILLPIFLAVFFLQRYIVRGLTLGAIK